MTVSDSVEIELKLALPPQQAAAFLKRMARRRSAPVQQALITRYFDTPAFALSEQGVALRVRRVGRRWLQTLKTEGERRGGLSRRAEYEMAVTRGSLDWTRFPAEAQAWVPEALRAQLAPGGRLIAPVGAHDQALCLIESTPSGFAEQWLDPVHFVPMRMGKQ